MAASKVYNEIIGFIASGITPQDILDFRPSQAAQERLETLIAGSKAGTLTEEESSELSHTLQIEHIMRLAKAEARKNLRAA